MDSSSSWTPSDDEDDEDFKFPFKKVKTRKGKGNPASVVPKMDEGTRKARSKRRSKLAKKTPEEIKRQRNEKQNTAYRNMDPDKKAALLKKATQKRKDRKAKETEEETAKRKAKQSEASKDPKVVEKRKARDARRCKEKVENKTPAENAEKSAGPRAKEYERRRQKRAQETPEERKERLRKANLYRAKKIAEIRACPVKNEERLIKQRERVNRYNKNLPKKIKQERYRLRAERKLKYSKKWYSNLSAEKKQKLMDYKKKWYANLSDQARQKKYVRNAFNNRFRLRTTSKRLSSAIVVYNQKLSKEERQQIERETRKGSESKKWQDIRNYRVTGSMVTRITKRKTKDPWDLAAALKGSRRTLPQSVNFPACVRGELLEPLAVERYMAAKNIQSKNLQHPVGFIIHPNMNYIGATPDCLITEEDEGGNQILGVVEIKSPMACVEAVANRTKSGKFLQITKSKNCGSFLVGPIKPTSKKFQINLSHKYFEQVCLQLISTEREFGDFVVFYQNDDKPEEFELWVQRIWARDYKSYMNEMLKKTKEFYESYMLKPQPADLPSIASRHHPNHAMFKGTTATTKIKKVTSKTMSPSSAEQKRESRNVMSSESSLPGRLIRLSRKKAELNEATKPLFSDDERNANEDTLLLEDKDPDYDSSLDNDDSDSSIEEDEMDNDFSRIH